MKLKEIDNSKLQYYNPWWVRAELIEEDPKLGQLRQERYVWQIPLLNDFPPASEGVLTLRGPRQIGKTTAIKLLIRRLLLDQNRNPLSVFFFACDRLEHFDELYTVIRCYLDYARPRVTEPLFLFLDEISFVSQWQRAVKVLVDEGQLKNALLVLTGSNTIDIKTSAERLPGRRGTLFRPDWLLLPLDFGEFVSLVEPSLAEKGREEVFVRHGALLKKLFEDYLVTGGFPVVINQYFKNGFVPSYLHELYWNWIEGDLHRLGRNPETALALADRLSRHLGSTVSSFKLARESAMASHVTAGDYLDILERMFVLFHAECFVIEQKKKDPKKNRKIYFWDPFIYSTLMAVNQGFLDDAFHFSKRTMLAGEFRPALAEMLVASKLKRRDNPLYYGKTAQGEVDFVISQKNDLSCYEVKYRENPGTNSAGSLPLTVITKNRFDMNAPVKEIPLELFLAF